MKFAPKKLRSAVKIHGGKSYLARRIISLMPAHELYVEPFCGGASVLLNKPLATDEIASDLDSGLIAMWRTLKRSPDALIGMLARTAYCEEEFVAACDALNLETHRTDLVFARDFIVRNRMSRGGIGKDFAWSDRPRGGKPGDVNGWETAVAGLHDVARRIENATFENCSWSDMLAAADNNRTLVYADPPYLPETRKAKKVYEHEMTRAQHEQLLEALCGCDSMVMLSGYANPLYDLKLQEWIRHDFPMPNHSGQGKTKERRVECVWIKP